MTGRKHRSSSSRNGPGGWGGGRFLLLLTAVLAGSVLAACLLGSARLIYDGPLPGKPVRHPVEIVRDEQGVPHVLAQHPRDLFFGLGYSMAQDRLFQMDLNRHLAQGRLCEWFGNLPLAKGMRLVQFDMLVKCFERLDHAEQAYGRIGPDERILLDGFVEGINQLIQDRQNSLPFSYRVIRCDPEPWTAADVLSIAEIFGVGLSLLNIQTEILRDSMEHVVGRELSDDFFQRYGGRPGPDGAAEALLPRPEEHAPYSGWRGLFLLTSILRAGVPQGSNNWVVSGSRSAGGMPMLANDPHVPLGFAPSFWYQADLEGGGFSVQGLLYPGYPALGAGWNGAVAWGVTNIMADQIDLIRERIDPENQDRYLTPGGWTRFEARKIVCKVRLGRDRRFDLKKGLHGFLVPPEALESDYTEKAPWLLEPASVKYVETDPAEFFGGQLELMKATDSRGVKDALRRIGQGPTAFNYVWATRGGEIGCQAAGRIPIRKDSMGSRVRDGWSPGWEWTGYIPFDELLSRMNPPDGFLHSANERIAPLDGPRYITDDYVRPYRSLRIRSVLSRQGSFSPEDFMALQGDVHNLAAERILPVLFGALGREEQAGRLDPEDRKASEVLRAWDLQTSSGSPGAALFEVFHQSLLEETFSDETGDDLSQVLLRVNVIAGKVLDDLLDEPESAWFDRKDTPGKEGLDAVLLLAWREAHRKCGKWLGKDPADWAWGDLHSLYLGHPLGLIPLIGRPYRIGTLPYPGDNDTVNGAHFYVDKKRFPVLVGAASRIIVDLARPDGAWFNCSTGMSEEPSSPYFENLTPGWYRNGYFRTLRMEKPEAAQSYRRLILLP